MIGFISLRSRIAAFRLETELAPPLPQAAPQPGVIGQPAEAAR